MHSIYLFNAGCYIKTDVFLAMLTARENKLSFSPSKWSSFTIVTNFSISELSPEMSVFWGSLDYGKMFFWSVREQNTFKKTQRSRKTKNCTSFCNTKGSLFLFFDSSVNSHSSIFFFFLNNSRISSINILGNQYSSISMSITNSSMMAIIANLWESLVLRVFEYSWY